MSVDENNVPDCIYTNQSETSNSVLSAKKSALGYLKKDDMSKGQFIRKVWEGCVRDHNVEVERALYGQSERYRLEQDAK